MTDYCYKFDKFDVEVSRIDDKALTMTFELYMDFKWEEPREECRMRRSVSDLNIYRIMVNPQSPHWDGAGHFMASTNFLDQMWLPDIQVPLPCTLQFLDPSSALDLHVQTVPQAADSH